MEIEIEANCFKKRLYSDLFIDDKNKNNTLN